MNEDFLVRETGRGRTQSGNDRSDAGRWKKVMETNSIIDTDL